MTVDTTLPNRGCAVPVISLSFPEPSVALLTFDTPGKGANVLSRPVLDELAAHLDALETRGDLTGLILNSAKPGIFLAGADLREFVASIAMPQSDVVALCRRGQQLFGRLAQAPFVTIAAIDGVCLGGGAELAVACDRRILTTSERTEYGFPEVKLGLFPGWGGTARLPRLIGLGNAVEMISTGESASPEKAFTLGIASDVAPASDLLAAALRMVAQERKSGAWRRDRERLRGPVNMSDTELAFLGATAAAMIQQETKGQYPAPGAALSVMLETAGGNVETALEREAEEMAKLFGSSVNAALLNVFFLTDRNKRDAGSDTPGIAPAEVRSVAVVGAGIMGAGIAAACVKREVPVVIDDASPEALAKGVREVLSEVAYDKQTHAPDSKKLVRYAPLVRGVTTAEEMAGCELVIEAIVEQLDAKRQLYQHIEPLLKPGAVLASNTSTIPITTLAEGLARPDRFCGMHFFNPVRRMKLVEVIRGAKTSEETVATAVAVAKRVGKSPIVVQDCPGFLVNRVLFPYLNESLQLVSEGAELKEIDRASTQFGMPMGPIALYDMVGLDTAVFAGMIMYKAYSDRTVALPIIPALMKAGRLGQKNGLGFYNYQNKKQRAEPDPNTPALIEPYIRSRRKFTAEELTYRLFFPMLLEATRVLEERIVRDPRDVDLGVIFALGFPAFRGGLLYWADSIGAARIVELLKPFEPLGKRFHPTPLLLEMAKTGAPFYDAARGRGGS